jgi:hypothetical protein
MEPIDLDRETFEVVQEVGDEIFNTLDYHLVEEVERMIGQVVLIPRQPLDIDDKIVDRILEEY